jgi:peptidyl-prolyl cis-trans isomerase B (cyclophilin B)
MTSPPPYGPPPDPYGQSPYGPPWGGGPYPYPQPRPTNAMAIASLVCAFVLAPLGIIFGHISLSQIKRTGEDGRGLAITGLVLGYLFTAIGVVTLVVGLVLFSWLARISDRGFPLIPPTVEFPSPPSITASPLPTTGRLPAFTPPADLGANCTYPATDKPADKRVAAPRSGKVPTVPARVNATMTTTAGAVGLQLDNGKSPCTVNSFVSLAQQGYFDNTPCHRLTTTRALSVLQCGDPSGRGTGGPGYKFADEYPVNQYRPGDAALQEPVVYPRGTLAMANSGPGSNGSQFFIIYEDSQLPPSYTVFGSVDATGMATVDKIAAGGVAGGANDGKPAIPVTISSVRLD